MRRFAMSGSRSLTAATVIPISHRALETTFRAHSASVTRRGGTRRAQRNIVDRHIKRRREGSGRAQAPPLPSTPSVPPPVPVRDINVSSLSDGDRDIIISEAVRKTLSSSRPEPLLVCGAAAHHRAASAWTDLEYLRDTVGADSACEVEIGGNYDALGGARPQISFGDYVDYLRLFIETKAASVGDPAELVYLAQNRIFDNLAGDVVIPSVCSDGGRHIYQNMLWIGPPGTVSPLHHDPLDSVFLNYVGEKRMTLYPPTKKISASADDPPDDDYYYAGTGPNGQTNTSPVDVEEPNLARFPRFVRAPPATVATLGPGDALFVPARWWHHVRATSGQFVASTNIWFK